MAISLSAYWSTELYDVRSTIHSENSACCSSIDISLRNRRTLKPRLPHCIIKLLHAHTISAFARGRRDLLIAWIDLKRGSRNAGGRRLWQAGKALPVQFIGTARTVCWERGLCNGTVSVRRPSVLGPTTANLQLQVCCCRRHRSTVVRPAWRVNAGSATLSAYVLAEHKLV